jgi:uncharacterized delta-60 repeat protein
MQLKSVFTQIVFRSFLGAIVFGVGIATAIAAPWNLDPGFGTGGKVIWSPNGNTESAHGSGLALQPDGKIVMVGGSSEVAGGSRFIVVRFTATGSVDTTFGNNGVVVLTFGGSFESGAAIAVQPDGKIVAGGRADFPGTGIDMVVARLLPNGSLDPTFDTDGKAIVNFVDFQGFSQSDYMNALEIASDGKIVVAGGAPGQNTLYKTSVGRLNSDGSLDTSFSGDGRILEGLGTGLFEDLVTNADGSIALISTASGQFSSSVAVVKYSNTGAFEWEYRRSIQPQCYLRLNGITVQPDGKYIAVGSDQTCKAVAIRVNTNGSLDTSFNNTPYSTSSQLLAVGVQADGKILATIGFGAHNDNGFSLIRYNSDGTVDSGFGNGGVALINVLNNRDRGYDLIIQPDGKILVGAGTSVTHTSGYRFGMARYLGSASVPQDALFDYDGDGKSDVSVFRPSENKWYILRSSDFAVTQTVFALQGDVPVPSDYDGDNRTDLAIYRPASGMWWYLSSSTNQQIAAQWGGSSGDIPRPSDFDGDGRTDYVYFRTSESLWYRVSSAGGTASNLTFGSPGDKPLVGDFDGDGIGDAAIFRPFTGHWWYKSSIDGSQRAARWGISTDIPAPADFDGDGRTDFAVYRPSEGGWYIVNSSDGSYTTLAFGISEDKPIPGDYDGDGKADIAVFRPSTGAWYLLRSTSGFGYFQWGIATDIPTENAFIP